jgi:glycosyltransferase involved in cell wall biosynthesis
VAAVGRLHPQKRPDLFLQACRWISAELPGTRFLVVGDGPERKRLEKLARAVGLAPVIHFAGMVDDVPELCRGISLLLHCADNEGTPRAVLHAMAAGCAVVATGSAGAAELITDRSDGVLVPCGDASGIAKQAVRLLQRPETRWELGQRARLKVESGFSIDLMRRRVEDAYRSVMSTSQIPIEESL